MLYHGSNEKIESAKKHGGAFGDFLFFSDSKESAESHGDVVYEMDEDDLDICEPCNFVRYDVDKFVEEIQELCSVDYDEAHDFLCEHDFNIEFALEIQEIIGRACQHIGFDGIAVDDEHGTSYMIDISKHYNKMVKL